VGARAIPGNPRAGVARRGDDDDPGPVRRSPEGVPQVVGGHAPRVRREIDQCVAQRPAGALLGESADEAVGVDPVGGAEIGHSQHRLVRKLPGGGQHGGVGRLESRSLR
jgi:hypothetical protein